MVPMLYDFPENTWVRMRKLHLPNVTLFEAYSWSLFKSTSHMLSIGKYACLCFFNSKYFRLIKCIFSIPLNFDEVKFDCLFFSKSH